MIEKLILKYKVIRDNYRHNARKYRETNDELYNRYRLRANDLDSVIFDLEQLNKK